ncbi:glycosyltransferase family 2 protein [bacterium]|nr:glycosyltransferase family 2 protein [bacterium]
MSIILCLLYVYLIIYTVYMLVLAVRNLKDRPFSIERKYSIHDDTKHNFGVIIYSHNNKVGLEKLISQLKMQDYPLGNFKVYAVLDNCNDGSETLFENDKYIHVLNIQDVGTLGKSQAISMLLEELKKDDTIDSYIFIDSTRRVESNFLTLANSAIEVNDSVTGEVNIDRGNLDIIDKIKAVYKKYIANFFKQARTLCGLATVIDSGLFIIRKSIIDEIEEIDFKDINSELEFSLYLTRTGHKCVYNPNIQSYIYGQDCTFKNPKITKKFEFIKDNIQYLKTMNFPFIEQVLSLLNPNFWTILITYVVLMIYSYNYEFVVQCRTVVFSAILLLVVFGLSLINAKLSGKEIFMLMLHPLYSICHIIRNFPPVRYIIKKLGANTDKDVDKLVVDAGVLTKHGERTCKLEFISTESGLAKIRFIYKNKKYTTDSHLRMIDALQQLKSKMADYALTLKICSCCSKFTSVADGTANMLKGQCHNDYPSPLLTEPKPTLIWNSCSCFEPAEMHSLIEELAKEVEQN